MTSDPTTPDPLMHAARKLDDLHAEVARLTRERDELRQSNRVLSHQLDRRADGMDDLTQLLRSRLVEANQQRDEARKAARWMLPFVALDGAGYGRVHEACQRWPWLESEVPE